MSQRPWVSVLMPTCNGAAYLRFALDSIIAQSDAAIECLVIDDASTDETTSVLEAYSDRLQLQIRRHARAGNWVRSTNEALELARGEFVSFLHQDDIWLGGRIAALRQLAANHPDVSFFLGSAQFMDSRGREVGRWRCPLPALPRILDRDFLLERLLVQNFVAMPAPLVRRQLALDVGGLDERVWYTADWDFWLRLAARGISGYVAQPLAGFRIHARSQTVMRSALPEDFKYQHESIAQKHLALWTGPEVRRAQLQRVSHFSIQANVALAGSLNGRPVPIFRLMKGLLELGPLGAHQYFRDSRILERTMARVRARLQR